MKKVILDSAHYVIGLAAQTSNAKEEDPNTAVIPKLWEKFYVEGIADRIPHRTRPDRVLAVYTDYEVPAFSSQYTIIIGCEVVHTENIPTGLVTHTIPAGTYAVITSTEGPIFEVVPAAWRKIWAITPDELEGKWAFSSNFEVYDIRSADFSQGIIDIYMALE